MHVSVLCTLHQGTFLHAIQKNTLRTRCLRERILYRYYSTGYRHQTDSLTTKQKCQKKKQLPSKRNHQSPDLQIFLIDHSGDDIRFCHTSMLYSLARPAKPSRPDPAYPSSTQPPRKKPVKAGANRTDQLRFISSTSTRRR
jgi:hypothetical protein